jgi:hypothetical protein
MFTFIHPTDFNLPIEFLPAWRKLMKHTAMLDEMMPKTNHKIARERWPALQDAMVFREAKWYAGLGRADDINYLTPGSQNDCGWESGAPSVL